MAEFDNTQMLENEGRRFTEDGSGAVILHTPQCVNCIYNTGMNGCDSFGTKPEEYLSNFDECPMRKDSDEQ